ncbi:MAG: hypothetical protein WA953_20695 [Priestia megaterium]
MKVIKENIEMNVNKKWFLAKYEPASKVGAYKWDYKFDNSIEAMRLVNRYLIESLDTVILFSEEDISKNLIVDYLKNEELHLWRNKAAGGILNFLSEKRIGLVYKHGYFFHEEATARPELEETVFICYVPWILT